MRNKVAIAAIIVIVLSLIATGFAAPASKKGASPDELKQYIQDLKKNPGDKSLREKIIKMTAKSAPAVPEEAERNMARGTAFAQKAADSAGYKKAIAEFESAANAAPWLSLAYFNLGVMQEKAGLFAEAIQSLKYYLLCNPDAKNARDVKNKIYALEADAEALQAGMNAPSLPEPAPSAPAAGGKQLSVAGRPSLEVEADAPLKIIKMPQDKKARMPKFEGNWYFKEHIRGEDVTIHAFEIAKNANGDLTLVPPKRAADSVATVNIFEISDKNLKLEMKWKMRSVVGYWKTETYALRITDDGSKLSGNHNQRSVGGRNIDLDRVLFRQ
jgi:tetratricopeptide (TPR) repeat protein